MLHIHEELFKEMSRELLSNLGARVKAYIPSRLDDGYGLNINMLDEINSQKIGFVKVGQKADISIDSYPASDFGVIKGEITRISSDALPPKPSLNQGFRFPADVKIENQFLNLKNGKTLRVHNGMSLTANIKLRKVSYLQLLLGTFKDKADSLREI